MTTTTRTTLSFSEALEIAATVAWWIATLRWGAVYLLATGHPEKAVLRSWR